MEEGNKTPRLPLLNLPSMHSRERSGIVTPPLQTLASIPFGWEEEPGKPRPWNSFSIPTIPNKSLELPPRLLLDAANIVTKLPSPINVLDEHYMSKDNWYGNGSSGVERGQLGNLVFKEKEWFGSWRRKNEVVKVKKNVFSSCIGNNKDTSTNHIGGIRGSHNKNVRMRKVKHYGSFINPFHAKSSALTKLCEELKHVVIVPWKKSEKLKKYGCWWS